MFSFLDKIKNKLLQNVSGENARYWLAGLSFAESSFFPIPPDFYLMPVVASKRDRWIYFALITTVASVLGGLFGYFIGAVLFDTIGEWLIRVYSLADEMQKVSDFFNQNAFLSIFTAAFTPIPYKVFTIAGGLFNINIFVFTIASILGRGIRFFAVSYIMSVFGDRIGKIAFKYFNLLTLIVAIIFIIFILYKIVF